MKAEDSFIFGQAGAPAGQPKKIEKKQQSVPDVSSLKIEDSPLEGNGSNQILLSKWSYKLASNATSQKQSMVDSLTRMATDASTQNRATDASKKTASTSAENLDKASEQQKTAVEMPAPHAKVPFEKVQSQVDRVKLNLTPPDPKGMTQLQSIRRMAAEKLAAKSAGSISSRGDNDQPCVQLKKRKLPNHFDIAPPGSAFDVLPQRERQHQNVGPGDLYVPSWNVLCGDSIRDRSVALQVSNNVLLPADRARYSQLPLKEVADRAMHYLAMAHSSLAFMAETNLKTLDETNLKVRQQETELANAQKEAKDIEQQLLVKQETVARLTHEIDELKVAMDNLKAESANYYRYGFEDCRRFVHSCYPDIDISSLTIENYLKDKGVYDVSTGEEDT